MMRKGRVSRLMRLGGMAVGLAGDVAGASTKVVRATRDAATADFHRRAAKRMLEVFGDMKGLPLKAGQMLSYIDEMLPAEHRPIYNELLGKLQRQTPPMDWSVIREVFAAEYDGKDPDEVFARFDPEPIAAASIGQVYRAATREGDEVVVKIQYPGVAEAVRSDLDNAETLVAVMSTVIPGVDLGHFVEDIVSRMMEECDYVNEARNQRDFRGLWAGDPEVLIPRVYDKLSTGRILVSEYLDGQDWATLLATNDPQRHCHHGQTIFRFVFQSLYGNGIFNGDPHPGNYLFYPDGHVAFIDYGCVLRYPDEQTAAFEDLREAILARQRGPDFQRLLVRVFQLPAEVDGELMDVLENYMHLSFQPVTAPQPYRFTREYCKELFAMGMDAKMLMTRKMLTRKAVNIFNTQGDGVAFLGRINFGLGSILAALGAQGDFREMFAGMGRGATYSYNDSMKIP